MTARTDTRALEAPETGTRLTFLWMPAVALSNPDLRFVAVYDAEGERRRKLRGEIRAVLDGRTPGPRTDTSADRTDPRVRAPWNRTVINVLLIPRYRRPAAMETV